MKHATEISLFLQQRINIWFCVKIGLSLQDTKAAVDLVYGETSLSVCRIRFWYRQFSEGRTTIVDLQRGHKGHSARSQANVDKVKAVVEADRRATVTHIAKETQLSVASVHRILTKDLQLLKKCAKYVPRLLTPLNTRKRRDCCEFFLRLVRQYPTVLSKVVTMDESWVYQYDPEMKQHSKQWLHKNDPRPIKAIRARATGKVLLVSFFDSQGVVYYEYTNKTIGSKTFIPIMEHFLAAFRKRRPKGRMRGHLLLHMDNAPAHTADPTRRFLERNKVQRIPHPPYSPDLAPSDFWFFGHVKQALRGQRFQSLDHLKDAVDDQIANISSLEYKLCIMKTWIKRLTNCVAVRGHYFEGFLEV